MTENFNVNFYFGDKLLENENIKKTTYDVKVEYSTLRSNGIKLKGVYFDVMLASYVNEPANGFSCF